MHLYSAFIRKSITMCFASISKKNPACFWIWNLSSKGRPSSFSAETLNILAKTFLVVCRRKKFRKGQEAEDWLWTLLKIEKNRRGGVGRKLKKKKRKRREREARGWCELMEAAYRSKYSLELAPILARPESCSLWNLKPMYLERPRRSKWAMVWKSYAVPQLQRNF